MHLHLPKPLHGWREFTGEVGIIVIGVLIALGAEQVVELFHQRAELREAQQGMTVELRDDDLPQAYARAAIFSCYADQLDAIEQAVAAGDRARFVLLADAYRPIFRTWDDQAWQAAMASQVLVYSGAKQMQRWATAYVAMPMLTEAADAEQEQLPLLRAGLSGKGPLSPEQQDRLFQAISRLQRDNRRMSGASLVLLRFAGDAGVTLTQQQKSAIRDEARRTFGACVTEPSPQGLDMQKQLSVSTDRQLGRR